jgi:hypothetical protein
MFKLGLGVVMFRLASKGLKASIVTIQGEILVPNPI